jgi:hypothetical protein
MAADNRDRTDQTEAAPQGQGPQRDLEHHDSRGGSTTTQGGPGTSGSVPASRPGAPRVPDDPA